MIRACLSGKRTPGSTGAPSSASSPTAVRNPAGSVAAVSLASRQRSLACSLSQRASRQRSLACSVTDAGSSAPVVMVRLALEPTATAWRAGRSATDVLKSLVRVRSVVRRSMSVSPLMPRAVLAASSLLAVLLSQWLRSQSVTHVDVQRSSVTVSVSAGATHARRTAAAMEKRMAAFAAIRRIMSASVRLTRPQTNQIIRSRRSAAKTAESSAPM